MILVDSSVWIDYLRGGTRDASMRLDGLLGHEELAIGDLMLAEVLQGFDSEKAAARAEVFFDSLDVVTIGGADVARLAAFNYRSLRRLGVTVRKTIDTLIATRCVLDGHALLHDDRDFDAFEQHLGLRVVR